MSFDFKKEYKEFYMPKGKPEIVTVPKINYIAVRGKGNPNEEDGEYKKSIELLYGIAYTIKMSPQLSLQWTSLLLTTATKTIFRTRGVTTKFTFLMRVKLHRTS